MEEIKMEILVVFQGHSCHETTEGFCWSFFRIISAVINNDFFAGK